MAKASKPATPPAKKKSPKHIKELTLDPMNANIHTEYGTGLLENSIRDSGFGRSILISEDNVVIAGNGTVEAAGAIGLENVQVVETDGNKIIAVKRTDIKSGTPEFYRAALADNVVATKNILMDAKVVEAIAEEYGKDVSFWTGIVLEPIDPQKLEQINLPDADKANLVQVTFTLSGRQGAALNKAIKISKQVNKTKFDEQDNQNSNGNALFFIVEHYLQQHKHVKVSEDEKEPEAPAKASKKEKPFISREEGGKGRQQRKGNNSKSNRQHKRK